MFKATTPMKERNERNKESLPDRNDQPQYFLFNLCLTRQVSYEQILIYIDGLGTVG